MIMIMYGELQGKELEDVMKEAAEFSNIVSELKSRDPDLYKIIICLMGKLAEVSVGLTAAHNSIKHLVDYHCGSNDEVTKH
jgi:hypothetical protein